MQTKLLLPLLALAAPILAQDNNIGDTLGSAASDAGSAITSAAGALPSDIASGASSILSEANSDISSIASNVRSAGSSAASRVSSAAASATGDIEDSIESLESKYSTHSGWESFKDELESKTKEGGSAVSEFLKTQSVVPTEVAKEIAGKTEDKEDGDSGVGRVVVGGLMGMVGVVAGIVAL